MGRRPVNLRENLQEADQGRERMVDLPLGLRLGRLLQQHIVAAVASSGEDHHRDHHQYIVPEQLRQVCRTQTVSRDCQSSGG